MTTQMSTPVWILNPVTGEWLSYPLFGTTPNAVLVEAPSGAIVRFTRQAVRWTKP